MDSTAFKIVHHHLKVVEYLSVFTDQKDPQPVSCGSLLFGFFDPYLPSDSLFLLT